MRAKLSMRMIAAAALGSAMFTSAAAQTKLTVVTFAGATNLPIWVAIDKGFFAREGLDVTQEITRGSVAEMEALMSGKYQFGSSALDNIIANAEGSADKPIDGFDL